MKQVASHGNTGIFAPAHSRFSFLKSPYAAHMTGSAVDIYYGNFGGGALSPVSGEIIDIRGFDSPTPFKNRDSREYLIAISQGEYVIKVLHVKPDVSTGETISKGERIGTFIKNGYFIFWNDPAMHVEVRRPADYLRASNDLSLAPDIEWGELPSSRTLELECRVDEINDSYSLLSALSSDYDTCGDVGGFALAGGFLDGYIDSNPGDGFFGLVKPGGFNHPQVSILEVTRGGREVECGGIAFCLSFSEPRIKVIPMKYGDRPFSRDETIFIRIGIK